MKVPTIIASIAAGAQLAAGHATVFEVAVNGKAQGVGNKQGGYIDTPPNNNPIVDVTSSSMFCNVPNIKASASVTAAGGDEIAFEWHHDSNSPSDDIIASSHHGPILVYIAKAESNSWVKIAEDGWDGKSWAVDKIIAGSYTGKKGQHKCKLPNLAPGDYVLRAEIIALHEGNRQGGAQFYPSCTKLKLTGSGSASLPAGVQFPGAYKANDPGVLFDIYSGFSSYPIPGPAVWSGGGSGGGNTNPQPAPTTLVSSPKPSPGNGSGGTVTKYGQCGGSAWSGSTTCASGLTCTKLNEFYSQCL